MTEPTTLTRLTLSSRPPADFGDVLAFLARRAVPGLEQVEPGQYRRLTGTALVQVDFPAADASGVQLSVTAGAALAGAAARVERMFGLKADPEPVNEVLAADPRLRPLVEARPGLRVPGVWDGFEGVVRAVAGQFVSVAAATTFVSRIADRFGTRPAGVPAGGPKLLFPGPKQLVDADFSGIGLTRSRAETIRMCARALLDGTVSLEAGQPLGEFISSWTQLRGIGPWTAHYLALRVLGHPDAFPAGDLVLRRMMAEGGGELTEAALRKRAEAWRPYRAYAALHLWHEAQDRALP